MENENYIKFVSFIAEMVVKYGADVLELDNSAEYKGSDTNE